MVYKKITFLFLSTLFFYNNSTSFAFYKKSNDSHAIYIGVVQVRHMDNRPTADIIVKVFQDDLQDVLRDAFGIKKTAGEIDFCSNYKEEIETYFQAHLKCFINEQSTNLILKKEEKQQDVYLLNFEMNCPLEWKTVVITADFFIELFPTQSNILQLENGKEKRFGRVKKGETEQQFEF